MAEIFDTIKEMLSYSFMLRALLVGLLVSLCASLLGVSLVLKRYSMIGDGLSHVGFGALSIATVAGIAPLALSVPVVIAAAFLLLRISENSKLKGDSAIAIISTGSLALGVMMLSFSGGMNVDVCNYMFGSILSMSKSDVYISLALCAAVLILYFIFYNRIYAITFDEAFAKATGMHTSLYNMLLALLTALTIVLGMRIMGALLISSLVIFPALTSMRLFRRFRAVTLSSAIISIVCFVVGIVFSYMMDTPAGASVVCANIIVFIIFSAISVLRRDAS